jgi:protein transport protein SEC61 subunit gamma-like protein
MENDKMADDEESTYEELQDEFESKARGFGKGKYGRIIKMARTPSADEYKKTVYITALGIVLIGFVGFAIWWLMTVLPKYF